MNEDDLSQARNPDIRASFAALRRAAEEARKIAIATGTGIVVMKDGKIVEISARELQEQAQRSGAG